MKRPRQWWADCRAALRAVKHRHIMRGGLAVHVVYYAHAAAYEAGAHFALSAACAAVLLLELLTPGN